MSIKYLHNAVWPPLLSPWRKFHPLKGNPVPKALTPLSSSLQPRAFPPPSSPGPHLICFFTYSRHFLSMESYSKCLFVSSCIFEERLIFVFCRYLKKIFFDLQGKSQLD